MPSRLRYARTGRQHARKTTLSDSPEYTERFRKIGIRLSEDPRGPRPAAGGPAAIADRWCDDAGPHPSRVYRVPGLRQRPTAMLVLTLSHSTGITKGASRIDHWHQRQAATALHQICSGAEALGQQ